MKNKTLPQLLKSWTTKTLKETQTKYLNALTYYTVEEQDSHHYKRMKMTIQVIQDELNIRKNK